MKKITAFWDGFPTEVPHDIRRDIVQMLSWLKEPVAPSDELLATRAVNLYLTGVNHGISAAQANVDATIKSFGKGARS